MDQTASSATRLDVQEMMPHGKVIDTTFRRDGVVHLHNDFALLPIDHFHIRVRTFEEDGRSWRQKYEESEASRKILKQGMTATAQLYTEAMSKVPVRCSKCRRFTDRTGRCQHCVTTSTLDNPDSKGDPVTVRERWLP